MKKGPEVDPGIKENLPFDQSQFSLAGHTVY